MNFLIDVVQLVQIHVQQNLNHVRNNVYQIVFVKMDLFWLIIDRVVHVFLHLNVIIVFVMIQMLNIQNVVRHVLEHVMTN